MRAWGLAWTLAATLVLAYGVASACTVLLSRGVTQGYLGIATEYGHVGGALRVPRNVAVVDNPSAVDLLDAQGLVIELEPVPGTRWSKPVDLLEPGARVSAAYVEAVVDDAIDEAPPSRPELTRARVDVLGTNRGCGYGCVFEAPSTCDGIESLQLTIAPSSDDYSPPERITYAVYGGAAASEAEGAELPIYMLVPDEHESELTADWGGHTTEHVQWIAIAAVDQAGNVSERTAAARLRR